MSKRERKAWAKHLKELANRREEQERLHRLRLKVKAHREPTCRDKENE